jgi:hypothetical protein
MSLALNDASPWQNPMKVRDMQKLMVAVDGAFN